MVIVLVPTLPWARVMAGDEAVSVKFGLRVISLTQTF